MEKDPGIEVPPGNNKLTGQVKDLFNLYLRKSFPVSDLAWLISGPVLISSHNEDPSSIVQDIWCQEQSVRHSEWLRKLDNDPALLIEFLDENRPYNLGKYFELLVAFWLNNSPFFQLIAHNVQIDGESGTIGEIDFLFRDIDTGQIYHWETAVKFYLGYGDRLNTGNWIGPNVRDTLEKKVVKLFEKQLHISQFPEARTILDSYAVKNLTSRAFIKGWLFTHLNDIQVFPDCVNPRCLKGWWCHNREFKKMVSGNTNETWRVLEKPNWLSGMGKANSFGSMDLVSYSNENISNKRRAIMVENIANGSRGFIVDDNWPMEFA